MKKKTKNKKVHIVAIKTHRARKFTLFVFETKKDAKAFGRECLKGGCLVAYSEMNGV